MSSRAYGNIGVNPVKIGIFAAIALEVVWWAKWLQIIEVYEHAVDPGFHASPMRSLLRGSRAEMIVTGTH